ncbi:protein CBFA2T3 [Cydia splendana]|uniref:protein CBFA2T3 n=1 Tax=Cydia splendana TaxID=1100963 RepID=UPI00300DB74B
MEAKVKEEVPDKDYQPSTTERRKPPAGKEHRSPEQEESRSSPTPGPPSPQNNGTAALSSTESLSPPLGEARAPALLRLRRFLSALLQFASDVGADTAERVKHLIYNLASGTISIEEFQTGVQECTNYPLRASVPGFLRALLPAAQRDLHARARRAKQVRTRSRSSKQACKSAPTTPSGLQFQGSSVPYYQQLRETCTPGPGGLNRYEHDRGVPNRRARVHQLPPPGFSSRVPPCPTTSSSERPARQGQEGTNTIEEFQTAVQECINYPLRASVPGFLRALLPAAQRDLHARARRAKQTPLQYVRAHEHLILESGGDGGDIFAQPGDSLKRRASDPFYEQTNGSEDFPPHAKRPPPSSLFLNPSPFLYPLPSNASLFDYGHYHGYHGGQEGGFERRDGGISVRDVSSMNASFPERLNPSLLKSDDEWKNINTMLNCILSMVEKTKRALAILQQRGVEPTESNDIKRAASEIMAQAVRQTEERVAEVRRRAEDAVNQVKRQALVELQRAVGAAEARALELVANERKERRSPAPAPSPPQQNCCWNCGRKAQETCSGCNSARYCGAFCQHKDWESHHQVCAGRDQKPTALRTSPPATQPTLPNMPTLPTLPTLPSLPKPTRAPTPDNRLSLTTLNSADRLHTNQDRSLSSTSNDRIALATLSTAQGIISGIGKK